MLFSLFISQEIINILPFYLTILLQFEIFQSYLYWHIPSMLKVSILGFKGGFKKEIKTKIQLHN